MKLPVPRFRSVKEVFETKTSTYMIAPDHNAGHRYSVVKITHGTGAAEYIGRELPLGLSREIIRKDAGDRPA